VPLLAEALPVTPVWLTEPGIVRAVPRRPFPRVRMQARRVWFALREIRWWALLALLTALLGVVLAVVQVRLPVIQAVAALSITLAILATKEEP